MAGEALPNVNVNTNTPLRLCAEDTLGLPDLASEADSVWGLASSGFETVTYLIAGNAVTSLNGALLGEGITPIRLIYAETNCNTTDTVERTVIVPTNPNSIVQTEDGVTGLYPCFDGGSLTLTVSPAGDGAVLWSNGAMRDFNTPAVAIDSVGEYSAQITQDGCLYRSDTLTIATASVPPAPVITELNGSVLAGTADYTDGARLEVYEGAQDNPIGETTVSNKAWSFTVPGNIPTEYIFWARLLVDSNCDGVIDDNDTPGPFSPAFSAAFQPPTLITPRWRRQERNACVWRCAGRPRRTRFSTNVSESVAHGLQPMGARSLQRTTVSKRLGWRRCPRRHLLLHPQFWGRFTL